MPLPLVLAPLAEGAITALVVWGTRVLFVGSAAGAAVVLNEATKDTSTPTTKADTTTVVGKGKMNCGDNGSYEDLLKKDGEDKLDRDHVPSKAALKETAEEIIRKKRFKLSKAQLDALFGKGNNPGIIAKKGQAIAIPKKDHQQHSDTYAGRNNPDKIKKDSEDLQKAAEKDTKTIEEAEGKEMDDECAKKYKKAADKIRKKTHAEYEKELTDLIIDAMKNVK